MAFELYEKVHEIWKDRPDESTPCMGADLMHFEDGIYNNSSNIKEIGESFMSYEETMNLLNRQLQDDNTEQNGTESIEL